MISGSTKKLALRVLGQSIGEARHALIMTPPTRHAELGRPVVAKAVSCDARETIFEGQGSTWPEPRIEMREGFNSGWIDFGSGKGTEHRLGRTTIDDVARNPTAGGDESK